MTIETKIDFKRYLKLMYILTYRNASIILLTIIGLIALIMGVLNLIFLDNPQYMSFVMGFILIAFPPVSVYMGSKKNFSSHGRLKEKMIYEFTDNMIKITGETFNSEFDWSKIYKITELKDWILIYQNRQIANIIPKESFGENIIDFKNLVRGKNIRIKFK